jgi:hypothetical protein
MLQLNGRAMLLDELTESTKQCGRYNNILSTVVLHLLGPLLPVCVVAEVILVLTQPVAPSFKAVAAIELDWHPNRLLPEVPVEDVREPHLTEDQGVDDISLMEVLREELLKYGDVERDDVVAYKKLSIG